MNRISTIVAATAVALAMATPASAQWAAACGKQLEITVRNETRYTYLIKLDGVEVRTVRSGEHIHVIHPHGSFQLEATPTNGGPRFTQRLEMHTPFVWRLQVPPAPKQAAPVPVAQRDGKRPLVFTSTAPSRPTRNSFYTQSKDADGIKILASADVKPEALDEAAEWVHRLLACCPVVAKKLRDAAVTIVIVSRDKEITAVPENRHLRGVRDEDDDPLSDIRGMTRDSMIFVGEENLIYSPSDPHRGGSTLVHELAHAVENVALSDDAKQQLRAMYWSAWKNDLWDGTYASKNPAEYFAEVTRMYFGVAQPSATKRVNGPIQLRRHDPNGYEFVHAVFTDRSPERLPTKNDGEDESSGADEESGGLRVLERIIETLRKAHEEAGSDMEVIRLPSGQVILRHTPADESQNVGGSGKKQMNVTQ